MLVFFETYLISCLIQGIAKSLLGVTRTKELTCPLPVPQLSDLSAASGPSSATRQRQLAPRTGYGASHDPAGSVLLPGDSWRQDVVRYQQMPPKQEEGSDDPQRPPLQVCNVSACSTHLHSCILAVVNPHPLICFISVSHFIVCHSLRQSL